ncbi:MAG: DNA-3-methyladenine glycosylase [Limisphaerales bacterium]
MSKLPLSWYQKSDTLALSRALLGKYLVVRDGNRRSSGIIVETEGYVGKTDRACHAFAGRRTPKNETMYGIGGTAYVYICYGIHKLFNVITYIEGEPHAVLIRAIEPVEGINQMIERRGLEKPEYRITKGPGSLSKALGITMDDNALLLNGSRLWIEDRGLTFVDTEIVSGPRVGVSGAGPEAASKPWRFWVKDNKFVSRYTP